MISSYRFKSNSGIWLTVEVKIDGTEPAIFNDYDNTLHCSASGLAEIERMHTRGINYRDIIESFERLSEVEI